MSSAFWIGPQSHFSRALGNLSAAASCQAGEVLARGKYRIGRVLLVLAMAACATEPSVDPPSAGAPRDLALHIIEVNSDGKGDKVNRSDVIRIEMRNSGAGENHSDIRICERADESRSSAVILREQFKCVIRNAIDKYKTWSDEKNAHTLCKADKPPQWCNSPLLKLVFYFNGGLNSKGNVMETAGESYLWIEHDRMYPIYMVWPTGGPQSYGEDVARVRAGRVTKWYDLSTFVSTPVRPLSDLLRGLASTPAAWATSFFEFSQTTFHSDAYMMERDWKLHVNEGKPLAAEKTVEIKPDQNLYFSPWQNEFRVPEADDPSLPDGEPEADLLVQDGGGATAKELASFAYHGATAPVRALTTSPMVGLGEAGWRNMVRRTRTSVRAPGEFPDEFAEEAPGGQEPNKARATPIGTMPTSHPRRRAAVHLSKTRLTNSGGAFRVGAVALPGYFSGSRAA